MSVPHGQAIKRIPVSMSMSFFQFMTYNVTVSKPSEDGPNKFEG